MNVQTALDRIGVTVDDLNARERRMGMPALHEADVSWPAIGRELQNRLTYVGVQTCQYGRPTMDALERVGAWVVIAMQALDHVENLDVTSGDGEERLAA